MTTHAPQTLDHDRFQAAVKAARDRFAMLKAKHPTLKGYLVLSIPGKQTGIGSGAKEILADLPALQVDEAASASSCGVFAWGSPNAPIAGLRTSTRISRTFGRGAAKQEEKHHT